MQHAAQKCLRLLAEVLPRRIHRLTVDVAMRALGARAGLTLASFDSWY